MIEILPKSEIANAENYLKAKAEYMRSCIALMVREGSAETKELKRLKENLYAIEKSFESEDMVRAVASALIPEDVKQLKKDKKAEINQNYDQLDLWGDPEYVYDRENEIIAKRPKRVTFTTTIEEELERMIDAGMEMCKKQIEACIEIIKTPDDKCMGFVISEMKKKTIENTGKLRAYSLYDVVELENSDFAPRELGQQAVKKLGKLDEKKFDKLYELLEDSSEKIAEGEQKRKSLVNNLDGFRDLSAIAALGCTLIHGVLCFLGSKFTDYETTILGLKVLEGAIVTGGASMIANEISKWIDDHKNRPHSKYANTDVAVKGIIADQLNTNQK